MLCHIIKCHPGNNNRYRCSYNMKSKDIEKRECSIWLQCNVCGDRIENVTKSRKYSLAAHKSHNMDFKTIGVVKRTKKEGSPAISRVTSRLIHDNQRKHNCSREIVCYVCDLLFKMNDHFNRDHAKEDVILRLGPVKFNLVRQTAYHHRNEFINFDDDNLVYYCVHCWDSWTMCKSNRRAYHWRGASALGPWAE